MSHKAAMKTANPVAAIAAVLMMWGRAQCKRVSGQYLYRYARVWNWPQPQPTADVSLTIVRGRVSIAWSRCRQGCISGASHLTVSPSLPMGEVNWPPGAADVHLRRRRRLMRQHRATARAATLPPI